MVPPIDPRLVNLLPLFWNLYQGQQQDVSADPPPVPSAPAEVVGSERLEARVDQLLLVVHAMWTLLQEKTGLTEADLLARVTDLDMQDGTKDGRVTKVPVPCPKCGAAISRKFNRCLFCGQPYAEGSAFDTV